MQAKIIDNEWVYLDNIIGFEEHIVDKFSMVHPNRHFIKSYQNDRWDGVIRKYNTRYQRLRLPFLSELVKLCRRMNIPLDVLDLREVPKVIPDPKVVDKDWLNDIELEQYQIDAIKSVSDHDTGIHHHVTGAGKCLGKDTPVLMFDGSVKMVQNIEPGDIIMGDDSGPRNVLSTCRGEEPLFRIKQLYGDDYVVNESHILSLKKTRKYFGGPKGEIVDIPIKQYQN